MGDMKKIIITGISGQDGSHMLDFLLSQKEKYDVYGCVRHTSKENCDNFAHLKSKIKIIELDLTDPSCVNRVVKDLSPDYFINFAAQSFVGNSWQIPYLTFQVNAVGVLNVLEAIRNFSPDTRFYSAGSSEEFGDVLYSPQDENHPIRPRSPYGASKAAARHLVKVWRESYGIYAVQGILFNHEGPRRGEKFVTRKITKNVARIHRAMILGKDFEPLRLGNLSAKRDWSYAGDMVESVWRMLNQDIYNPSFSGLEGKELAARIKDYVVSSGETRSVAEFVHEAFGAAGIDGVFEFKNNDDWSSARYVTKHLGKVLVEVDPSFYRPAEVEILMGNSSKIKNELGWSPQFDFKELVEMMVKHDIAETIRR